mgnify:CR=1 FL=1
MADKTGIEWTDATWNPVTGCTEVSPGCDHCYAKTFAERFSGKPGHYFERGFDVQLRPEKLDQPLRWRRPRRIFVNSMSDLFHDQVPDDYIARVFGVMNDAKRHTFQLLTKRHARMRSLLASAEFRYRVHHHSCEPCDRDGYAWWPLPNVWLGVSTENQLWADIRIPALLDTPAAVRFISAEPLLGPIDLREYTSESLARRNYRGHNATCDGRNGSCFVPWCKCDCHRKTFSTLGWVIVGGESGRGARPMHPDWARSLRDQCTAAGVPFLFKQWGEWTPNPGHPHRDWANLDDPHAFVMRVGKKAAGRELDGQTWEQYPVVSSV